MVDIRTTDLFPIDVDVEGDRELVSALEDDIKSQALAGMTNLRTEAAGDANIINATEFARSVLPRFRRSFIGGEGKGGGQIDLHVGTELAQEKPREVFSLCVMSANELSFYTSDSGVGVNEEQQRMCGIRAETVGKSDPPLLSICL